MTKKDFHCLSFIERARIREDFFIAMDIFDDCYAYLCYAISTLTDTRYNPSYLLSIMENGRIWNINHELTMLLELDSRLISEFKRAYGHKLRESCTGNARKPVQLIFSIFEED